MKTYGRLLFGTIHGKQVWGIQDLEPHVATAFKRLFPKASRTTSRHVLSDTDETRADIKWFIDRYPLDTKEQCLALLREGAERMAQRIADQDAVLSLNWEPDGLPPAFRPGKKPYLYQEQAVEISLTNQALLLADDVGLGKTITTYAAAARGAPLPMLIVVQAHLTKQWARKGETFTTLRIHVIRSGTPYTLPRADIYIISYGMLAGWIDYFAKNPIPSVAYDELQELRHGTNTAKGRAARIVSDRAQYRLGLTATPVYNMGDEAHTVMSYIHPDLLGTREEFLREWCRDGGAVRDPDALGSFLRNSGYFLRRDEDDPAVDRSMPRPNVIDIQLDYDEVALAKEEDILRMLATTVLKGRFHESGQAARELDAKMRMLTGVAKAKPVAAYVKMLLRERQRVLLAGWHRSVYDIWRYALQSFDPVLYSGSESKAAKDRNVSRFVEGRSRVMMISLRSGAGLDGLQYNCRDIVFGELDWSPKVHYQLVGRLRRPGQPHQVDAHYPHVNGGSDPVLMGMLGVKEDQSRGILDPGIAPKRIEMDMSRVKRLAQFVLGEAP